MSAPASESQAKVHPPSTQSGFAGLGLGEPILRAVQRAGHHTPTPIQRQAIPLAVAGKDIMGCAQTGTGKTAAFALPVLERLWKAAPLRPNGKASIRALILSPTRELAAQIESSFLRYGSNSKLRFAVVFGGVGFGNQLQALRRGVDILVATPGRLEDLMRQGVVSLQHVEILVVDEADRMLDQGFLPAIDRIVRKVPQERQTLCFSATMPAEIKPLLKRLLKEPTHLEVAPVASTPDLVEQRIYYVDFKDKGALLKHLIDDTAVHRALVFTRTKRGADRVAKNLIGAGHRVEAIHGNKSQNARNRALAMFKAGKIVVLVATDVAARGIDVDNISHVINYDLPMDIESYVHRIGRTARAGAQGKALSLCTKDDRAQLARIERLIKRSVPVITDHPFAVSVEAMSSQHPTKDDKAPGGGHTRHTNHPGNNQQFRPRKRRHKRRY